MANRAQKQPLPLPCGWKGPGVLYTTNAASLPGVGGVHATSAAHMLVYGRGCVADTSYMVGKGALCCLHSLWEPGGERGHFCSGWLYMQPLAMPKWDSPVLKN